MKVIEDFVIKLTLDGTYAKYEADKIKRDAEKAAKETGEEFKKAGDKADDAGKKAKKGAETAQSSWGKLADKLKNEFSSIVTGAMAIYGVYSAFSSYLSTADAMGKFADSIGQNIEDIHAWSEAVIRSGGSAEGFQGSLKSLSTQLSKMSTTGKSRAGNILESVGIDAGGVGRARKSLDVLLEISDKMQDMSKEEALGFGASLGIDSGTIMLLQQGRDAVADLVRKQKELGVYTKEDARITAEFNDAVADSKQAFMGFASIIFRMVTPALKWIVDGFTDFVAFLRKHEFAVQAFFVMLSTVITTLLIPAFNRLFWTIAKNPITWVVLILAGLALLLEDLYKWANNDNASFAGLWEMLFDGPEDARKSFETFFNTVRFVFEYLKNAPKRMLENFKNTFRQVEYFFKSLNLVQRFKDVLTDIQNASNAELGLTIGNTKAPIDELCDWINEQFTAVGRFIDNIFNGMSNTASSVTSAISGFFSNLGTNIKNAIGDAIDWALEKLAELAAAVRATPIIGGAVDYAFGGGGGSSSTVNTKIGQITVNTPARDANGIASGMGHAINTRFSPAMANTGTRG